MLTKIDAISAQGWTLSLPVGDSSAGYSVRSVDGLGPVRAPVVSSGFAGRDGEQFQSVRRGRRDMAIRLGMELGRGGFDPDRLRLQLNQIFPTKGLVTLRFTFNYETQWRYQIAGVVEDVQDPRWGEDPEYVIGIVCVKPDFILWRDMLVLSQTTSGTETELLQYEGTSDTGILFEMTLNRDLSEFIIHNQTMDGEIAGMRIAAPMLAGDKILISTISGQKYVRRRRSNSESSLLYALDPSSPWVQLKSGNNQVRVQAAGEPIGYSILYRPVFGSI